MGYESAEVSRVGTPLFVSHCDLSLIPRTPGRFMKAHTRILLRIIKFNVSPPEGDDKQP
jgi:hypothetical protein